MPRRLTILAVVILIAYWVLLFVMTHKPDVHGNKLFENSDKLAHCCAYALLAWLAAMVLRVFHWRQIAIWTTVLLACLTYAALDEWLQGFTKRQPDPIDWLADAVGVVVGLVIFALTHAWVRSLYYGLVGRRDSPQPPPAK